MFASVVSVLSTVIPFCIFLSFYHGNLFISASERSSSRGIEVISYLTPFLILSAFIFFLSIFKWLSEPKKILEIKKLLKAIFVLGFVWFCLVFFLQFLDGMINNIVETLIFATSSFVILVYLLIIGLLFGNFIYLKIKKLDQVSKIKRIIYSHNSQLS